MKLLKFSSAVVALCLSVGSAFALPSVFNDKLTASEKASLEKGETVIRNLKSVKYFSITSSDENLVKAQELVKSVKPAYLAEVIQVIPCAGNENLPKKLSGLVMEISSYAGIPYWSERHERWYDLYSSATVTSSSTAGNVQNATADLVMEPFGLIKTSISCETTANSLYYVSTNDNTLKYEGFTCVKPGKMKSVVCVFKDGDNWILYGIGAVNAPDLFFLRDRIETSFMNRIKTFCSFFFKKL